MNLLTTCAVEIAWGLRSALRRCGLSVRKIPEGIGTDAMGDMALFMKHDHPLVFDVGANVGQSIRLIRRTFKHATIHSFEPSPRAFKELQESYCNDPDLHLWNCGVGSLAGSMTLMENDHSDMSSFLPLGEYGWGRIACETPVPVTTLDDFCSKYEIYHIDILKSDTQGYDFEVLKGADRMFREGRVSLLFFEVIFTEMYRGLPQFGDIYNYLIQREMALVSFYQFAYQNRLAGWTDAVFVNRSLVGRPVSPL
jgi:FkbM family methyltransferase